MRAFSTFSLFLLIAVAGTAIREILAPFTGHPYDFELWIRLGYYVGQGADPYVAHPAVAGLSFPASESPTIPGYPPLWPLLLALIYKIYFFTGVQNRFFYYFLIKQPIVVSDIADGYLISKFVSFYSNRHNGLRAFAFWMLCPYTIIIGSVWGMFDPIVLLLVLVSIYFISKTVKSSVMESVGVALKLFPIIFLPLLAGLQSSLKKTAIYLGIGVSLSAALIYAPYLFFRTWQVSGVNGVEIFDAYRVANSINYWEAIGLYAKNQGLSHATYEFVFFSSWAWIPAVVIASLFCISSTRKMEDLGKGVILSCLFITLVYLVTKAAVSEQFVIYFLGFATFDYYVLSTRSRKLIFHAFWLCALLYLILNNQFLEIFLSPISSYYVSHNFFAAGAGVVWEYLISSVAIVFSSLCAIYAYLAFRTLRQIKVQEKKSVGI